MQTLAFIILLSVICATATGSDDGQRQGSSLLRHVYASTTATVYNMMELTFTSLVTGMKSISKIGLSECPTTTK